MEYKNAGTELPAKATTVSGFHFDQSIFLNCKINTGRNAKPEKLIRRHATCSGANATKPLLIKIKELPQMMERKAKTKKPRRLVLDVVVVLDK